MDHSRSDPLALLMVSELVSELLGEEFRVELLQQARNKCGMTQAEAATVIDAARTTMVAIDKLNFQWEALTREFLVLDEIIDRSVVAENLLPADMQNRLINLYQTYIAEAVGYCRIQDCS